MSALLGPLVELSPVVPAIATASALGLAALDTLTWQGRGSTLMLDWLAGFSKEHRARIIRHEAGHFLVARQLDIPVTDYTLSAWEALRKGHPGQGGVQFDTQILDAELQQGKLSAQMLDRLCTIWMAGGAAEAMVYGNAQGGDDDRGKLRALLIQIRFSAADRQHKERLSVLRAKTLLETHWTTYEALVAAMERRETVEECDRIIASAVALPENL
ncbi:ATP-dependent Zn protease [Leptolyngbya sp. Cla-17]|uniref:ATP-dependent Zn protease n=1 Tax=Leptolyngbya sp. Cla-17 TaxID=2803751 RepID=UPI001FDAC203|nr:ATP-dependent Zn protease [Leptolyngbya sp. Cla-17]